MGQKTGQELLLPCQNVHCQTVKSFLSFQIEALNTKNRKRGRHLFKNCLPFFVSQMKISIDEEVGRLYHWKYCKTPGSSREDGTG